jgi:outer membrane protein OmpA-like peptidoglycan-associated protein
MKNGLSTLIILLFIVNNICAQSEIAAIEPDLLLVKGKIMDEKTKEPLAAELDIFFDNDFVVEDVQVASHGEYSEHLKNYGWYIIQITAPGYLTQTDTLWVMDDNRKLITRDHYMTPIEVGLSVVLNDVYFYFGKTILKADSYPSLNRVAEFFKLNPQIKFEIGGHTDDEGADDYNLMLSEGRAKAVVEYLVKQGIKPEQLEAKGYGETKPIDSGITKAAKARNRRVEFVVVDIGA